MVTINYALQTHDLGNRENVTRYCGKSRSEITEKCVTSFMFSVDTFAQVHTNCKQIVHIFDDHSTATTVQFLEYIATYFTKPNVEVRLIHLEDRGILNSIKTCYQCMRDVDADIVYQVQDDYLFTKECLLEMVDVFVQVQKDVGKDPIVFPYNDPYIWTGIYRYQMTPRIIIPAAKRYWISIYDLSCSFMTSREQFNQHWDLYDEFFRILGSPPYDKLESESINKILTERHVPGVSPLTSAALHMQSEFFKDPYVDWKFLWDSVPELNKVSPC